MFEYVIAMYADALIRLLLTALGGCLGIFVGKLFRSYVNDKTKLTIAKAAVACVQQVWYALDGPGKMEKAMGIMASELAKKGIKFDEDEMLVYAEAAIAEFKEAFKTPVVAADTAGAAYRVPSAFEDDREVSGLLD